MTKEPGAHESGPGKDPVRKPPGNAKAVFLERQSYRRRRLVDVARLLPLLGVILLLVPLLWPGSDENAVASGRAAVLPMSEAISYIFAVWAILILAAALFGLAARHWGEDEHRTGDERRPEPGRD